MMSDFLQRRARSVMLNGRGKLPSGSFVFFQTVLTPMPSMAATSLSDNISCMGGGSAVSAFLRSLICVSPHWLIQFRP